MDHPNILFPSLIIILFLVFHFGTANDLSRCCADGSRHLRERGNCQTLRAGSTPTCARSASICCLRALIDSSCQTGVLYAQRHKMCTTVVVNELAGGAKKECCDCCLLAHELSQKGERCAPPKGFSSECLNSFNKCCGNSSTEGATRQLSMPMLLSQPYQSVAVDIGPGNGGSNCESANCEHSCTVRDGSVLCSCRPGFDLSSDGRSCVDVDECLLLVDDCAESQRCLNTPGGFKCIRTQSCGTGYAMDSETEKCVDVDECALRAHDCAPMYQCRNTQGSFRCVPKRCESNELMDPSSGECKSVNCGIGYKAIDGLCEDIDECREETRRCAIFEECVNVPGTFRCQEQQGNNVCSKGYQMDKDSGFCLDMDECSAKTHSCDTDEQCTNMPGTYRCNCVSGFEFDELTMHCEDVDECAKFGVHACSLQAQCVNTVGSHQCVCKAGFKLGADNRSCDDIDECASGVARCQQKCINSPGSYQCICERGYQLGIDEITCEDIDECAIWAKSGNDLCMGQCINVPGSFACTCPQGYQIMADGITCKDIDECQSGDICAPGHLCINLLGNYRCQRIECPRNYFPDRNYKNQIDDGFSCLKQCRANDARCLSNFTREILFQFRSVPSVRIVKRPIEISRITTDLNRTLSVEYSLKGKNAQKFAVEQQHNSGIVRLIQPIKGPQIVFVRLHIAVKSPRNVSLAHNLALIEVHVAPYYF